MKRISLLLPTRGRPDEAARFLKSVAETTTSPEHVEIIIYVDEDDATSHNIGRDDLSIKRIIGPRRTMGHYNSECLAQSTGAVIVLVNDDMVIRTRGWDEMVRKLDMSVPDNIYLAYGNDMLKKSRLCTFPILSRRTCEVLQEPYHHAYRGAFIDYHLMDIFKRLEHAGYPRVFYLDDLVFEHLHHRSGKAPMDTTYRERKRFADDMVFIGLAEERKASLTLLQSAVKGNSTTGPSTLPAYIEMPRPLPWRAPFQFGRIFLADRQLPPKWRFFLWWWFCARNIASFMEK